MTISGDALSIDGIIMLESDKSILCSSDAFSIPFVTSGNNDLVAINAATGNNIDNAAGDVRMPRTLPTRRLRPTPLSIAILLLTSFVAASRAFSSFFPVIPCFFITTNSGSVSEPSGALSSNDPVSFLILSNLLFFSVLLESSRFIAILFLFFFFFLFFLDVLSVSCCSKISERF